MKWLKKGARSRQVNEIEWELKRLKQRQNTVCMAPGMYVSFLQSHIGVKGVVSDVTTGEGIANALIQVKNLTSGSFINHDVTSGIIS